MIKLRTILSSLAAVAASAAIAGAVTLWSGATGDINFPGLTPTTINNMSVGATTPSTGAFSTLSASGAVSGAGFVSRFSTPGPIGDGTPSTGAFSTANTSGLATLASAKVDSGTKTATASGGAATLDKNAGVITSEALTTAGLADYTLTLTNSAIAATDQVLISVANGTNTQGDPVVGLATPGAGSVVIRIRNAHATEALNGTIKIAFVVFKN